MKGIGAGYLVVMTSAVGVATACALLMGELNPIVGSKLGALCLRTAMILFLVACSRTLTDSWRIRTLPIALFASIASTSWWYSVAFSGDYRITVSTSTIFIAELVTNTLFAVIFLMLEVLVLRAFQR